ncbi:MAG TPA: PilZ domain-containing protein [Phycisphaerae bacterium]|jgi:c-di-GMP-binding flagellar brake protein YcgR|nr:PilZ domain-containing protein [Phycisphaerae bacterium]HOJ53334.1 PilZ domain-containing protein [Phycisphaerae bacterium]HOL27220.1 PilZ domain-containing protein [Phycisphaerae bacterium]HPP21780.1 PilZ domain-containing protein [Phycisphaerae bacterium]HPU34183.1 PilZ domain-containing protein [Phycisphaerae bacterium]
MSGAIEISSARQEELLREAVSRQLPLMLSYRLESGWSTSKSHFLGFDRSSGDLVVAVPSGPTHLSPHIIEGQTLGVSFRRAHRNYVFETMITGRCFYSVGREDDVPAICLLWPDAVCELQRRLYYRTPLPPNVYLPVRVSLWHPEAGHEDDARPRWGRMLNLSAGGLSLELKGADNPRWQTNTEVLCSFVAQAGSPPVELYGHMRYLDEQRDGTVRMGVQFLALETFSENRPALEQVLDLSRCFQEMAMRRRFATV